MWERIQRELDDRIKAAGVHNAYFPLLIPEEYMRREAEHVEGFSPELAVVTHGGGKELEQPVVLRPTSETIINSYFAKWISSYRDLPLKINNWSNVVRWELRPRLFLRTTEFLWQEGHTAHETEDEARAFTLHILADVYAAVMRDVLAVPVLTGRKTERERFAGALRTWTCEGLMRDGKALQMGTSHELGQGFSRAFGTLYTDRDGVARHPWQTSWGASTRLVGAVIMVHGDDRGLRLPPRRGAGAGRRDRGQGRRATPDRAAPRWRPSSPIAGARVELDDRVDVSFGRRVVDWELKGVPVRLEVGPRDLAAGQVTLVRRARDDEGGRRRSARRSRRALDALAADQDALLEQATALLDARTAAVADAREAAEAARTGFARLPWRTLGTAGEDRLAREGVSVRCLVGPGGAFADDPDADGVDAIVARAY